MTDQIPKLAESVWWSEWRAAYIDNVKLAIVSIVQGIDLAIVKADELI